MEAGGYQTEISRARANGRVSRLRRDPLCGEATKSHSPLRSWERSEIRKGKAINFYGRKLSPIRRSRERRSALASTPNSASAI